MFAPDSRLSGVKESWRRLQHDLSQIYLDYCRSSFVQPDSVKIIDRKNNGGKRLFGYLRRTGRVAALP